MSKMAEDWGKVLCTRYTHRDWQQLPMWEYRMATCAPAPWQVVRQQQGWERWRPPAGQVQSVHRGGACQPGSPGGRVVQPGCL